MQHNITAILQKLAELNANPTPHQIDIDLMLEQTRKLYAELLELQQSNNQPAAISSGVVRTEVIETILPEQEQEQEPEPELEPVIPEIKPAELIQKLHVSADPEPTLEDLIPEVLNHAPEAYTPIPPIANVPKEVVAPILTEPANPEAPTVDTTMAPPPVAKSDHDIRKLISLNDKYQYISELFANDKETYEIVLTRLNKFDSYSDAVTWMDEVHTENRWDDEHPTVISFYDTMSHFFASR